MKFQLIQIVSQQLDREETIQQLTAAETKWILSLHFNSSPSVLQPISWFDQLLLAFKQFNTMANALFGQCDFVHILYSHIGKCLL